MQARDKGEGKECFTEGNVEIQVLCNIYYYYFPISTCLLPATSSFPLPPLGFVIMKNVVYTTECFTGTFITIAVATYFY